MSATQPSMLAFEHSFADLRSFVQARPEIELSSTGLKIPPACRVDFYERVDAVRRQMVASCITHKSELTSTAIESLRAVCAALRERLGLVELLLPSALQVFCDDPALGSTQTLTSSILSCLQGSVSEQQLAEQAYQRIPSSYHQLKMAVLEAWQTYALIDLLEPTQAFAVRMTDAASARLEPTQSVELGWQEYSVTLRLPEAAFATPRGLFALKFELVSEIDFYASKPIRRRDFSSGGDTHGVIGRRIALLYRLASPESSCVLADRDKGLLLHPALALGTLTLEDFEHPAWCEALMERIAVLSPTQGSWLKLFGASCGSAAASADGPAAASAGGPAGGSAATSADGLRQAAQKLCARPGAPPIALLEGGLDAQSLRICSENL